MKKRYIFDIVLTVLLVLEMLFQLTGDLLHEVFGVVFFATIVAHLFLSRKWMRVVSSKRPVSSTNKLRLVLSLLLGVCMIGLLITSIAISNVLLGLTGANLTGDLYAEWSIAHTILSYALCAIVAVHLVIHWKSIIGTFHIPYDRSRRQAVQTGLAVATGAGVVAISLTGVGRVAEALSRISAYEKSIDAQSSNTGNANANPSPASNSNAQPTQEQSSQYPDSSYKGKGKTPHGKNKKRGSSRERI